MSKATPATLPLPLEAVKKHFSGAKQNISIVAKTISYLVEHRCTARNTLYAQSICSDEINHGAGDITSLFSSNFGEVFHLGGLGGIPFTGVGGFRAFSHHVPKDSSTRNLFILFAPHIGVDTTGALGSYPRPGQQNESSSACGAAVGALEHCGKSRKSSARAQLESSEPRDDPFNFQMNYIISKVNENCSSIRDEDLNVQQKNLVERMYQISLEGIEQSVHFEKGHRVDAIYILGGIQINMPPPYGDYFLPKLFRKYINTKKTDVEPFVEQHDIPLEEVFNITEPTLNCV